MTNQEYIKLALRTESTDFEAIRRRLSDDTVLRIQHACDGLDTEQAELMDAMKKFMFYGRELDRANIIEEVGDLFWYIAILADACNFTFEEAQEKNIAKLAARYGDKFSEYRAVNRDLDAERKILEEPKTIGTFNDPATRERLNEIFKVEFTATGDTSKDTYRLQQEVNHNHMMERDLKGWTKVAEE